MRLWGRRQNVSASRNRWGIASCMIAWGIHSKRRSARRPSVRGLMLGYAAVFRAIRCPWQLKTWRRSGHFEIPWLPLHCDLSQDARPGGVGFQPRTELKSHLAPYYTPTGQRGFRRFNPRVQPKPHFLDGFRQKWMPCYLLLPPCQLQLQRTWRPDLVLWKPFWKWQPSTCCPSIWVRVTGSEDLVGHGGVKNASKTCSIVLKCGPKRTENEVHLGFRCNANTAQYHPGLVMLRSERCPWSSIKMAVTVTPPPSHTPNKDGSRCKAVGFMTRMSDSLWSSLHLWLLRYDLILNPDYNTKSHTQWYFFRVGNTRRGPQYRFNIINMVKPTSVYNEGMRPLQYSCIQASKGIGWVRCGDRIAYYQNGLRRQKGANYYTLTFTVTFDHDCDEVYFSHCYPYTYSDLQMDLLALEKDRGLYLLPAKDLNVNGGP